MKVVVTGAAGNLGRRVMSELRAAGHEVLGLDRKFAGFSRRWRRVNLLDGPRVMKALVGAEAVVHLGNHPGPGRSGRLPDPVLAENVAMNFNVFEAARTAGVRLIVYASSVQVMRGERLICDPVANSTLPWLPLDGNIPAAPSNPYALSKCIGEDMLRYNVRHAEITAVSLRFPCLVAKPPTRHLQPRQCPRLDEAFTWLTYADGARLIRAVLVAPLRGFRIYFPAAPLPMVAGEVESLRRQFFPGVPLKVPAPLTSFVNGRALLEDTGWTPRDV